MKLVHKLFLFPLFLLLALIAILGPLLMSMSAEIKEHRHQIEVLNRNYHFLNEEYCKLTNPELIRSFNRPTWERQRKPPNRDRR